MVKQSYYESCLSEYSHHQSAIALLRSHRPYLEMLPSLRRPQESLITIPLPVVRIRHNNPSDKNDFATVNNEVVQLFSDLAILMCDPEWKIKLSIEILVFIHRPQEEFSELLLRWRKTQIWLDKNYEWLMPHCYHHLLGEGSSQIYPLFVVFPQTPDRIKRGLQGAVLPYVMADIAHENAQEETLITSSN